MRSERRDRARAADQARRRRRAPLTALGDRDGADATSSGAPLGVILFFEDVTFLLRVERMEAWREVARRIAHEIKNPLTPIQLSAQRLRKRYAAELQRRRRGAARRVHAHDHRRRSSSSSAW